VNICEKEVKIQGRLIRVARIAEGYEFVERPEELVAALRTSGTRIDAFTFIQRLSDPSPRFPYAMEWDNLAAVPVSTFDQWFTHQINRKTRNMIRKAEKSGVTVREVPFDDALISGISTINNETPIRQGRPFWHYGDDLATVRRENGTFEDRSIFLGAFFEGNLIGYAKLTSDESRGQAGLMQIVSMIRHRDKAPTNLLLAQAVRSCAERSIPFLWYAKFAYGNKGQDTLADFKHHNGFVKVDVPRYYIPLTLKGRIGLQLGLHRDLTNFLSESWLNKARDLRNRWYGTRARGKVVTPDSTESDGIVAASAGELGAGASDTRR
jgi:hypothetical protein